ncbi:hypothetical protein [Magnetococcus sp. PR-3]|uniref:hypothetical protein n=1 Tax=Magnetococcus sp. PR-3 TaxID=3120355 RepID=UPI002FCDE57F
MSHSDKQAKLSFGRLSDQEVLREMARDMDVALYCPYEKSKAAKILSISSGELDKLKNKGKIAYLNIATHEVRFLGLQLLTYLLECVVPVGPIQTDEGPPVPTPKPTQPPVKAELISVSDALSMFGVMTRPYSVSLGKSGLF